MFADDSVLLVEGRNAYIGIVETRIVVTISDWNLEQKLKFNREKKTAVWFRKEVQRGQVKWSSTDLVIRFPRLKDHVSALREVPRSSY